MLITRIFLAVEVWDGKPTYRKSFGVVRFDLGPLVQGQMRIAKSKRIVFINRLLLVLEACNVNQPMGNHGLGIF